MRAQVSGMERKFGKTRTWQGPRIVVHRGAGREDENEGEERRGHSKKDSCSSLFIPSSSLQDGRAIVIVCPGLGV